MKYFKFLLFIIFTSSYSGDDEVIVSKKLLTKVNFHDPVTDDITDVQEFVYDQDQILVLTKRYIIHDSFGMDREYFSYNDINELYHIRKENNTGVFSELHVKKENNKIILTGWDEPRKINYYFNEENLIFRKEVVYSNNTNVYTFKHNSKGQLVECIADTPSPFTIKYYNFIDTNSISFFIPLWVIDTPLSYAFGLSFSNNGVPTSYTKNNVVGEFNYDIDSNNMISKFYYDSNNVMSFEYK